MPQDNKKLSEYKINVNSKAFKRFDKAGLLNKVDYDYLNEVQEYWLKHYKKEVSPITHLAYMNLTGEKDKRIVPSREMWNEMLPFFNDMPIRPGYSDKNMYDTLVKTNNRPDIVLKRVHGNYFNTNNEYIDSLTAEKILIKAKEDLIIKPSNADNGQGVGKILHRQGKIYYKEKSVSIEDLEKALGHNFIVQTVIKQHPLMAEPHPASVNSLRMVTFRWKGEIRHLLTYARFGGGNNVKDHAIAGGVSVSVDDDGVLGKYGLDTHCIVHTHHPTTNFSFVDNHIQIPNYKHFTQFVVNLHNNILHHDYVSWDIAVGEDGEPVFIEPNFRGTTWRYQLAAKRPIFGDLTEEVLQFVSNELNNDGYVRSGKYDIKKLIKQNNRLKKQNEKSDKEIIKLKKTLSNVKKDMAVMDKYYTKLQNIIK